MKSLVGDYREEHLFCLRQSLESYRHYQERLKPGGVKNGFQLLELFVGEFALVKVSIFYLMDHAD